jgi:glycosyltransferase involved in cell wall biosynthesis
LTDDIDRSPGVTFVIYQIGASSNGGVVSVGEIIARVPLDTPRVMTNRRSAFATEWERNGSVVYWRMDEGGHGERRLLFTRALLRLANNVRMFLDVRRNRTSVVHINNQQAMWNSGLGAKLAGAKVLFNVRDAMREGASKRKWRLYLKLADRFLVLSREMQEDWQKRLSPLSARDAAKFRHLYSIVDRVRYSPASDRDAVRTRLGLPSDDPVLLYAARFEPKKGQLPFIRETLPQIVDARPDAFVHFLGDFAPDQDTYAAACAQAVKELGLADRVRFAGHTPAIEDWYRAADLILLASQREGLARCMIEGIASGTPVVSFAVCSAREVLEAYGVGVVVAQQDFTGFAATTVTLLNDKDARAGMAARGPRVAAELFDPERVAAGYTALIDELTRGSAEVAQPAPSFK